jgi:O-acetyl-ADP-ribose deacetylase (regulator of RNase III)
MIIYTSGNLFGAPVVALVNPVNTVGVMGLGLALQFKERFPENYTLYRAACAAGIVQIGRMFVTYAGPQVVVNFPTKRHWSNRSQLPDIRAGLVDLQRVVADLNLASIAIPALGCGAGGLDWHDVQPLIHAHVNVLSLTAYVYVPEVT